MPTISYSCDESITWKPALPGLRVLVGGLKDSDTVIEFNFTDEYLIIDCITPSEINELASYTYLELLSHPSTYHPGASR